MTLVDFCVAALFEEIRSKEPLLTIDWIKEYGSLQVYFKRLSEALKE
jgi:hypothetical protein